MLNIKSLLQRLLKDEKGVTGLESAILLAASVTVAGTVATSVITSGLDATQDVEKAYGSAMANIQGTFMSKGGVFGKAATTGRKGVIGQLTFYVSLVTSGGSVDFTPPTPSEQNNGLADAASQNYIVISYTDKYQHVENLYWTVSNVGQGDGDLNLESGELFMITVGNKASAKDGGNLLDALSTPLSVNTDFQLEVKGAEGATLRLERHTPPSFDPLVNLN